jgi:hypothetical protein
MEAVSQPLMLEDVTGLTRLQADAAAVAERMSWDASDDDSDM